MRLILVRITISNVKIEDMKMTVNYFLVHGFLEGYISLRTWGVR